MRPPLPGIVSLAHRGILLLDEINLFPSPLLDQLRNPLNDRVHKVQRLNGVLEYPCNFILVAAMNPCKCGWFNHFKCSACDDIYIPPTNHCPKDGMKLVAKCDCSQRDISRFKDKISKPMLDRIDLKVLVSEFDHEPLGNRYASTTIKKRISAAREIQSKRYKKTIWGNLNAFVPDESEYVRYCPDLSPLVKKHIQDYYTRLSLTRRMQVKIHLVSRTLADLEESKEVRIEDVEEATRIMGLDNSYFNDLF